MAIDTKRMDAILADIKERGIFPSIERYSYNLNVEDEMHIISAIGKQRTPKFVIDAHNRAAYENILKWCIGDTSAKAQDPETKAFIPADMKAGWWIAGNTGSGKTWCMEIMSAYCRVVPLRIDFGGKQGRLGWINHRADMLTDLYLEDGTFKNTEGTDLRKLHMLGIQDVCTEQQETVYMGNRKPVIRNILEYRGDQTDQITMVTSNVPIGHHKIIESYGDRVASRLHEMFNYIEIKGIDRRKK